MKIQNLVQSVAAVLLFGLAAMDSAQANPMSANITYFSIDSSDPDANHLCCTGGACLRCKTISGRMACRS